MAIRSLSVPVLDDAFPPKARIYNPTLSANQTMVQGSNRFFLGSTDELLKFLTSWSLNIGEGIDGLSPSVPTNAESLYVFSTSEITLYLSAEHLVYLLLKNLSSEVFHELRTKFGVFYEISDYFYDPETGQACRPIGFSAKELIDSLRSHPAP